MLFLEALLFPSLKPELLLQAGLGSYAYLPIYLGFFEFVHNAKKRGKALLSSLLELIMS